MFYFKTIIGILISTVTGTYSKCVFTNFDFMNQPVFSNVIKQKEIIFRPTSPSIFIGEGTEIKAYCKLNFTEPIRLNNEMRSPRKYYDKILIRCRENRLYYTTYDIPKLDNINQYAPLSCIQTISFYRAQSSYCNQHMLSIVLDTEDSPEWLGDLCYDPEKFETVFVHYATGRGKLDSHPEFFVFRDEPTSADLFESILKRTLAINKSLNFYWSDHEKFHEYRFDELVPSANLMEHIGFDAKLIPLNAIPWWTNLKDGNWKNVEDVTDQFTLTDNFDVYTGVQHFDSDFALLISDSDFTDNLARYLYYSVSYQKLQIPLFVWKYVKPKDPFSAHKEVVIIGINFPYIKDSKIQKLEFCSDICDQIEWLRGSLQLRKFPVLGYVFCCKANEIRDRIPTIEKIRYAYRNEF